MRHARTHFTIMPMITEVPDFIADDDGNDDEKTSIDLEREERYADPFRLSFFFGDTGVEPEHKQSSKRTGSSSSADYTVAVSYFQEIPPVENLLFDILPPVCRHGLPADIWIVYHIDRSSVRSSSVNQLLLQTI